MRAPSHCPAPDCCSEWKDVPLPPDTYFWGGVQLKGEEGMSGFHFADFFGDHVVVDPGTVMERKVPGTDVIKYCNCLQLPPTK